eukprot:UC4_evm1s393
MAKKNANRTRSKVFRTLENKYGINPQQLWEERIILNLKSSVQEQSENSSLDPNMLPILAAGLRKKSSDIQPDRPVPKQGGKRGVASIAIGSGGGSRSRSGFMEKVATLGRKRGNSKGAVLEDEFSKGLARTKTIEKKGKPWKPHPEYWASHEVTE